MREREGGGERERKKERERERELVLKSLNTVFVNLRGKVSFCRIDAPEKNKERTRKADRDGRLSLQGFFLSF